MKSATDREGSEHIINPVACDTADNLKNEMQNGIVTREAVQTCTMWGKRKVNLPYFRDHQPAFW